MDEKPKKKSVGPASYNTESFPRLSQYHKVAVNIPISGIGVIHGGKKDIPHTSKLKIKSNRFLDQIVNKTKNTPGVGHYKNLEKALDKRSVPPMALKSKRH